jgi:2-polyprenyl-3-methyl-5-hydroxy-6-metoxy-1,4-benzoquinol methylase
MNNYIELLLEKIGTKNPEHVAKLKKNLEAMGGEYFEMAERFYSKYDAYLKQQGKTLDFGVDCYLKLCADMIEERIKFIETGRYSSSSFEEVEKRVYGNSDTMTYHMHGLVLGQFLWFEQYERINFFSEQLPHYTEGKAGSYLEIGGGHGLYMMEAISRIPEFSQFDLVDISESSLQLAKGIINDSRVNYYLKNIFDFTEVDKYDFVTMGEVLEHVEEPLSLLKKIAELIGKTGVAYITTPVNSPMIDHIYLFNHEQEIRDLFLAAGLGVVEEKVVISEKIPENRARKFKAPIMYAAFVKPITK